MTADSIALLPQAQTIIRHNLRAQVGENILLVWDGTVSKALVDACMFALRGDGLRAELLVYEPVARRGLREYCYFAGASLQPDGLEIPPILHAAIAASDAVLLLCSDMDLMLAPGWRGLLDQSGGGNVPRMLFLPYLDTAGALRMLPAGEAEVHAQAALVRACGQLFEAASEARITSAAGTDLRMTLGQWSTRLHLGIAPTGGLQVLPAGQVTRVPDDRSAAGVLVIDRTIADNDYKALSEPVTLHIVDGDVIRVELAGAGGRGEARAREGCKRLQDRDVVGGDGHLRPGR